MIRPIMQWALMKGEAIMENQNNFFYIRLFVMPTAADFFVGLFFSSIYRTVFGGCYQSP